MYLSEIKNLLPTLNHVTFQLEDGALVPEYFHVTEVGVISKNFIDCGGTVRNESVANFQLWNADDLDHRLKPSKLLNIILLSEKVLKMPDAQIEVEYQGKTIEKYDLSFNGQNFILVAKHTSCLAQDACGIPSEKSPNSESNSCAPRGGCC